MEGLQRHQLNVGMSVDIHILKCLLGMSTAEDKPMPTSLIALLFRF